MEELGTTAVAIGTASRLEKARQERRVRKFDIGGMMGYIGILFLYGLLLASP